MRPPFIRVIPADVERHGGQAAILLALIRFRCESDGPGRFTAEGLRWWRVSRAELAHDTGLSLQGVRTALKALDGVVVSKHFPPKDKQARAYRVAADNNGSHLPEVENNHVVDLPEVEINHPPVDFNPYQGWNQPEPGLKSTSALCTEELETGGEARAHASEHQPASEDLTENPPPRICRKHDHWDHDEKCRLCQADRLARKRWTDASWGLLSEHDRLADFLESRDPERAKSIRAGRIRRLRILDGLGEKR